VFEHVVPSTPPSRKKFTAEVKKDFIYPVQGGTTATEVIHKNFAKYLTPHHTCWIKSDGWFVLPQLCPGMVQNDHYIHMLGACSRSKIVKACDTIVVKELITYHTTNHATDTQQVLSTKQPALIMIETDENNLPTMPQWIIPTDVQYDGHMYNWETVEIGIGQDQNYPNDQFKVCAADDRKTEVLPTYEGIFSTVIARKKDQNVAANDIPNDTYGDQWTDVTLNDFLGCDPETNRDWIDTAKLKKHTLKPGQGFTNNYHISQTTNWNKLVEIGTQRDSMLFGKPQTSSELREKCVTAISSDDYEDEDEHLLPMFMGEDNPEYDHLFIQANPQLFWWTPISGFTPTSQMQEGHPLAILQNLELQWSTQPEHTSLDTALAAGMKGLQLRSFKSQPTDFTYNPTIMFTLTTTTYSDSSWIKMDAIIDVKRTLVVEFDFDDACNFNINPYIDLTLKPHTIKHYYNYNSHPNYRSFRPGPRMTFKHKKKQGRFMPFK